MRRIVSGRFELGVTAGEAIAYFTPEGERSWAPGWSPAYPAGSPSEDPGTVFTTEHAGHETIWVIRDIDRVGCSAAYARVTPGLHAGEVRVGCRDVRDGSCVVSVTYDITLLTGADSELLQPYSEGNFAAMMDEWAHAVTKQL